MSSTVENLAAAREVKARKVAEKAKASAEAQSQITALVRDDVLTPEVRAGIQELGAGVEAVKATNGADNIITLYHAYDGRAVPMPSYMLKNRLEVRFPYSDDYPADFRGEQIWFLTPQPSESAARPFACPLSSSANEEQRAEMESFGLTGGVNMKCSKRQGFQTQFEAQEHFRKRHPRRYQAYQDAAYRKQQLDAVQAQKDTSAAILTALQTMAQPDKE